MTYHLARVGFWLQNHSLFPWPTMRLHQIILPINAELGFMWTILWWGTDQLSCFVQWITVPVIMVCIYGFVRLLGYSRIKGIIATLLWSTCVQVLFQSTSTQNDLIATSFWTLMVYFFFAGIQHKEKSPFFFSSIAFGLAFGTKSTIFFMLPGWVIILVVSIVKYRKSDILKRIVYNWGISAFASVLILGSYIYIQNTFAYGNPLGPTSFVEEKVGSRENDDTIGLYLRSMGDNTFRYLYQIVDFSPLPFKIASKVNPLKEYIFKLILNLLHIDLGNPNTIRRDTISYDLINGLSENSSWFGPLLILIIPAIIYQFIHGVHRNDFLRFTLSFLPIAFLLTHSFMQDWTPSKGRYYNLAVALAFPLIASILGSASTLSKVWRSAIIITGLVSIIAFPSYKYRRYTSTIIPYKQLLSGSRYTPTWEDTASYRMINEIIPSQATIGLIGGGNAKSYILFGEEFTRKVYWGIPQSFLYLPAGNWVDYQNRFTQADYIVVMEKFYKGLLSYDDYTELGIIGKNSVWIRNNLLPENQCASDIWPLKSLVAENSLLPLCVTFPFEYYNDPTSTSDRFEPIIGNGTDKSIGFNIYVKEEVDVIISIDIDPRNNNTQQELEMTVINPDETTYSKYSTFDSRENVYFDLQFEPGNFSLRMNLTDDSASAVIKQIQISPSE